MFDFVHKHKRLLQVMLGLVVIPPFALWGIQSYERGASQEGDVANVAGNRISEQEFAKQLRSQQERMRSMLGGRIDPAIFDTPHLRSAYKENICRTISASVGTSTRALSSLEYLYP